MPSLWLRAGVETVELQREADEATKTALADNLAKTGKSGAKLMKFKMFFG